MADETTPPGGTAGKEAVTTAKELEEGLTSADKAQKELTASVRPAVGTLRSWNLETDEAIRKQQTLAQTIKDETQAIIAQARQVGSLQSQFRSLSGAIQSNLTAIQQHVSICGVYNKLLDEMRTGQKAFTASLMASTANIGQATAEADKIMYAYRDAMASARVMAGKLGVDYRELQGVTKTLTQEFASQIAATGRHTQALEGLRDEVVYFSKFMRVDYAQTIEHVRTRMMSSNMTLKQTRREMRAVAFQADLWTRSIQKMGREAGITGKLTRKHFYEALKSIREEFKGGLFDEKLFAAATRKILEHARRARLTPDEARQTVSIFGRAARQMQDFGTIFGARAAQTVGAMMQDLSQIKDEALRARLKPYEAVFKEGRASILDLQAVLGATRGTELQFDIMIKTLQNLPPVMRRVVLGHWAGPGKQFLADTLLRAFEANKFDEMRELMGIGTKKSTDERAKQLDVFEASYKELIAQGHSTGSITHLAAKTTYEWQQKVWAWLEKYPALMAAILGGTQLVSGLAGGLIQGLIARKLLLAGVTTAATTTATTAATTTAGGLLGKGMVLARLMSAVGPILQVALPAAAAAGGYYLGTKIDKWMGGMANLTAQQQALAGKDLYYSGFIASDMLSSKIGRAVGDTVVGIFSPQFALTNKFNEAGWKDIVENTVRVRGVLTENHKKLYAQNQKRIAFAKANWGKLNDAQKEQIRKLETQNGHLKRFIDKRTMSTAQKKSYDRALQGRQTKDILDAFARGGIITGETPAERARSMAQQVVSMAGRRVVTYDPQAALQRALADPRTQAALAQAGVTRQQFQSQFMLEVARRRFTQFHFEKPEERRRATIAEIQKWMKGPQARMASPEMMRAITSYLEQLRQQRGAEGGQRISLNVSGDEAAGAAPDVAVGADGTVKIPLTTKTTAMFRIHNFARGVARVNARNAPTGATG